MRKYINHKIEINTLMAVFITGAFSLGAISLESELREDKKIEQMGDAFLGIKKIYQVLQSLKDSVGAKKILIFKAEDHGGIPSVAENDVYSSIIYEVYEKPLTPKQDYWQRERLDAVYSQILSDVYQNGEITLVTKDLPVTSKIRRVYDSSQIKKSHIVSLYKTEKFFLYLSVVFMEEGADTDSAYYYESIRIAKRKLVSIIEKDFESEEEI